MEQSTNILRPATDSFQARLSVSAAAAAAKMNAILSGDWVHVDQCVPDTGPCPSTVRQDTGIRAYDADVERVLTTTLEWTSRDATQRHLQLRLLADEAFGDHLEHGAVLPLVGV